MFKSAINALGDLTSPDFRAILWKSIGLTLLLFVGVFLAFEALFWFLTFVPWPWLETLMAFGTGLGLLVVFFFLMAPVTAIFAGLYLDDVAERVEQRHYASDAVGQPLSALRGLAVSLRFGLLVLAINILALPLVFTGIGAIVLVLTNAYLLSREYFEMAAMRHMSTDQARKLRQARAPQIFVAGLLPAVMALVPVLNLVVPLFATSYFVHLFKKLQKSSA